jgi:hypothetical protein
MERGSERFIVASHFQGYSVQDAQLMSLPKLPKLKPGDCLLYSGVGFFSWLIQLKTWHRVSHIEVYIGDGYSVAARDGIGVNAYPVREKGLYAVLRPNKPFSLTLATYWFLLVAKGQKYDWKGLLRFASRAEVVGNNLDDKMFCSEFAARFYRAGGLDPFNKEDADAIAPATFLVSPYFDRLP